MPRLEIFTGTERRRRWPDADKLRILEEAAVPGISAASVARRHDILPQQLYQWRRQFGVSSAGQWKGAGDGVAFLPLELIAADRRAEGGCDVPSFLPSSTSSSGKPVAEVVLRNGRLLRVAPSIDAECLQRLIQIAETA